MRLLPVLCGAALVFVTALPACGGCDAKKEPTVVYVDAEAPAVHRRPFDRRFRDSGIPRFRPHGSAGDASAPDASLAPIE